VNDRTGLERPAFAAMHYPTCYTNSAIMVRYQGATPNSSLGKFFALSII
jgi:hypothetical protein